MDPHVIELATQIASGASDIKWLVLFLIAAIGLVALYVHARTKGFAERLGQIEAEAKKIDTLVDMAKATTKATEEIKSDIGQRDWRERERIAVYRANLERAVTAAFEIGERIEEMGKSMYSSDLVSDATVPGNRLTSICVLFFPGLLPLARQIRIASIECATEATILNHAWINYELHANVGHVDTPRYEAELDTVKLQHAPLFRDGHIRLLAHNHAFAAAAATEMRSLVLGESAPAATAVKSVEANAVVNDRPPNRET